MIADCHCIPLKAISITFSNVDAESDRPIGKTKNSNKPFLEENAVLGILSSLNGI